MLSFRGDELQHVFECLIRFAAVGKDPRKMEAGKVAVLGVKQRLGGRVREHDVPGTVDPEDALVRAVQNHLVPAAHALQLGHRRFEAETLVGEFEEDADLAQQYRRIDRFEQIVDRAGGIARLDIAMVRTQRGDEDDRNVAGPRVLPHQAGRFKTIHVRHLHVHQHDRVVVLQHQAQRFLARHRGMQLAAERREYPFERKQVFLFIVDEQ